MNPSVTSARHKAVVEHAGRRRLSWATMLADYDLSRGRIWLLVPIVTAVLPRIVLALSPTHVPPRGALTG